ncbi:VPS10 domain-containing protein [Crocosphaera subtropica]|nr:YCF48-related protein [Crocosphaera subtropica]
MAHAHRPHDVIKQVEISPNYNQDKTIYIIVREQLLKSENGGKSWYRLFRGLDNNFDFSSLSVAPKNPKILYISAPGDGIYRSQDGGLSWRQINQGLDDKQIALLSISPHSPNVVLAASKNGSLYLTNDGGGNWISIMTDTQITAISFAEDEKKNIAVSDSSGKVYFSSNEGFTWTNIVTLNNNENIQSLAFSPTFNQEQIIWIGTEKKGIFKVEKLGQSITQVNKGLSDQKIRNIVPSPNYSQDSMVFLSTWDEGVFQSKDKGNTWKKISQGLTKDAQADEAQFSAPHFQDLKISQTFSQDKTLFLGGFDGLFTSTNGGKRWQEIPTLSTRVITSLAISPNYKNDSTVALGTYEKEAYITKDGGKNWKPIIRGFATPSYQGDSEPSIVIEYSRFYDLIFSPNYAQDQTLFATFLYKLFKSTNQGDYWQQIMISSKGRGILRDTYIVASPDFANDKTVYIVTKNGGFIYRSNDKGQTFSVISKLDHPTNAVIISPNFAEDKTLFVSGINKLYKTIDGGKTWQIIADNSSFDDMALLQLVVSPNYAQDQTIFLGTNQGILKTIDGGKKWEKLANINSIDNVSIEAMAISPDYQNDQTLIASVRGLGLIKTMDSGETFEEIGRDFNKRHFIGQMVMSGSSPLHFSPNYAQDKTIYGFGSSMANLYKSTDGGLNWEVISIPRKTDFIAEAITQLRITKILLNVYPALRFLVALIVALPVYPLLGIFKVEKKLPIGRAIFKTGITASFCLLIFVGLSII